MNVDMYIYWVWGLKWIFLDAMLSLRFKLVKYSRIEFFGKYGSKIKDGCHRHFVKN